MSETIPRLMIVGATWEQAPLIERAREMGCHILATNPTDMAEGFEFANETAILDPRDLGRALELASGFRPDGVTADECDYSHYAAVYVSKCLGLPNDGLTPAQFTTNKLWMREQCQQYHILQPRFLACRSPEEAERAVDVIGWPVIVKPVDNRGASGVNVATDLAELRNAYLDALRHSHSRNVIVEAYIIGTHITVDGCVDQEGTHHNLALASKEVVSSENPLITEVNYPGDISDEWKDHLCQVNHQVVEALEIKAGLTHSEFIVDGKGRTFLVETANRGGGVLTSAKIVPAVSGVDLSDLLVSNALRREFAVRPVATEGSVSLRFLSFPNGRVRGIAGVERASDLEGVLHLRMLVGCGDWLEQPTSGPERHGFAVIAGACKREIEATYRRVLETIQIEYEDA